jgi:hypothetical protein
MHFTCDLGSSDNKWTLPLKHMLLCDSSHSNFISTMLPPINSYRVSVSPMTTDMMRWA